MQGQTLFEGDLDGKLHLQNDRIRSEQWKPATEQDRKLFAQPFKSTDRAWVGSFALALSDSYFPSAVVMHKDGSSCLYIDLSHPKNSPDVDQAEHFSEQEKICFQPLPADKDYSGALFLELPLPNGPYRTVTVPILLPAGAASTPPQVPLTLLSATHFYVEGNVLIAQRNTLMRFEYDTGRGDVDLKHGYVWLDLNGDGMLDDVGESDLADGNASVFHVGDLYLKAKQIDLASGVFSLETVPASEYTRFDVWKGGVLPNFAFDDLNGTPHHLRDLKGKYVLFDFWATWCASCVADMESLKAVYAQYHDRGFEILGIHAPAGTDTTKQAVLLVEKMKIPWPQALASSDLMDDKFKVRSVPFLMLVDQQGHIIETGEQKLQGDNLGKTLAGYLPTKE